MQVCVSQILIDGTQTRVRSSSSSVQDTPQTLLVTGSRASENLGSVMQAVRYPDTQTSLPAMSKAAQYTVAGVKQSIARQHSPGTPLSVATASAAAGSGQQPRPTDLSAHSPFRIKAAAWKPPGSHHRLLAQRRPQQTAPRYPLPLKVPPPLPCLWHPLQDQACDFFVPDNHTARKGRPRPRSFKALVSA